MTVSAFGSWATPFTAATVASGAVRCSGGRVSGSGSVFWAEERPTEAGRTQLVRRGADGHTTDLLPAGFNARTAVHEYGGGDWWTRGEVVWFANWADQRLYRLAPGGRPEPLTPDPASPRGDRYADGDLAPDGLTMVVVREHHPVGGRGAVDVRNEIVRLDADTPSTPEVLVSGPDFVASPRFSPDGTMLVWVSWDHPSMPWDDTVLTVRDLATGQDTVVAGGPGESVIEPRWDVDGTLYFVSDRVSGWWNLYRWRPGGEVEPVIVLDAEIGVPASQFGSARYALLPDGRIVFARWSRGYDGLALRAADGIVTDLDLPFSAITSIRLADQDSVVVTAATPTEPATACQVFTDGSVHPLRAQPGDPVDPGYVSVPEYISFPSTDIEGGARVAHGLFYPPANPNHTGPQGSLPPLIVQIHGGPTSKSTPVFSAGTQFWTSRGFAVVDVDYGGSTGYGRAYREQLRGTWGRIDVTDCLAAARWLAEQRRVDGGKLLIRGGSAGGFTTLAALARSDTPFAAGADLFGVADLAALAQGTHKFESRYLDRLVGPYPQASELYAELSPINHIELLTRPLIVLQGAEDPVVLPNQSELIVAALRDRKVPVAYLLFDGEQHGFRQEANIRRALEAELSFYSQVFGFALPAEERIEPVFVENL